jgi:hypothetical protein
MQRRAETLTRAEVARKLGKSVGGVRYLEGKTLHPRQDADGVWRFDLSEVEPLVAQGEDAAPSDLSPGKLAARACQLFRDGKSVVDVVIALEQPFEIVQTLYRAFTQDSGGMRVPEEIVQRIAAICEIDKVTPEIVVQVLEEQRRKLTELSALKHGARIKCEPRS